VKELERNIGINIRYSTDETGNNKDGGDWILESDNVNIKELYFNENIYNWDVLLEKKDEGLNNLHSLKKLNCSRDRIVKLANYKLKENELIKDKLVDNNNKEVIHNSLDVLFKKNPTINNFKVETSNLCLDKRVNKKYLKVVKSGEVLDVAKEINKNTGLYANLSVEYDYVLLKMKSCEVIINRIEEDKYELFRNMDDEPEIYKSGEIVNINKYKIEFGGASVDETTSSGSGGDPYITTLYNLTYKLKDIPGFYRIYEGKNIIINAETKMIDEKQRVKINSYGLNMKGLINTGTLYSKLYVKNEYDSCIIDLENEQIITNKGNKTILIGNECYDYSGFVLYKDIKCIKKPILIKNSYHKNIILSLEYFDIPQIENTFNIVMERIPCYEEHTGLLVNNFKQNNMKLNSLSDCNTKKHKSKKYEKMKMIKEYYENWLGITNKGELKNMYVC
jgi:hypothetical protein